MKLTKNTNKVRIELSDSYAEIYEKQDDGSWIMTDGRQAGIVLSPFKFQRLLTGDDGIGFKIFDISEDEEDENN